MNRNQDHSNLISISSLQSELYPNQAEVQIMDYQTQQAKLFPAMAMAFSFHFAGQALWNDYEEVSI